MKIYLGVPRGFCAGVVRAIDLVELALKKYGPPIYVKHQIVHNSYVVDSLENKGAITVEDVNDIPRGAKVVFSAHGSSPEDFTKANNRNLEVIDAIKLESNPPDRKTPTSTSDTKRRLTARSKSSVIFL